jgi:hypothetical protein
MLVIEHFNNTNGVITIKYSCSTEHTNLLVQFLGYYLGTELAEEEGLEYFLTTDIIKTITVTKLGSKILFE